MEITARNGGGERERERTRHEDAGKRGSKRQWWPVRSSWWREQLQVPIVSIVLCRTAGRGVNLLAIVIKTSSQQIIIKISKEMSCVCFCFFPNSHKASLWSSGTALRKFEKCCSLSYCCQQCGPSSSSLAGVIPKRSLKLYCTKFPRIGGIF